jgi:hypothetical protein
MFKPGDIVKITKKASCFLGYWCEGMDDVIGDIGEVFRIDKDFEYPVYVKHKDGPQQESDYYGNYICGWWFPYECLEIVGRPAKLDTLVGIGSCPNCKGELKDHYSEWAGKDIKKCKKCGWC